MLVSNQRPLPCESGACSFVSVHRHPIPAFPSRSSRYVYRGRPSTFAPVVVKLSSEQRLPKLLTPYYLYAPACVERGFSEVRAAWLGGPRRGQDACGMIRRTKESWRRFRASKLGHRFQERYRRQQDELGWRAPGGGNVDDVWRRHR